MITEAAILNAFCPDGKEDLKSTTSVLIHEYRDSYFCNLPLLNRHSLKTCRELVGLYRMLAPQCMRKVLLTIVLFLVGYCAIYFVGKPFALRNEKLARVWATAFYPLIHMEFHRAGVVYEKGTIQQNTDGGWSLDYLVPKKDPHGHSVAGIGFRVPPNLQGAVVASNGSLVEVGIDQEPDPKRFGFSTYVLTSIKAVK